MKTASAAENLRLDRKSDVENGGPPLRIPGMRTGVPAAGGIISSMLESHWKEIRLLRRNIFKGMVSGEFSAAVPAAGEWDDG